MMRIALLIGLLIPNSAFSQTISADSTSTRGGIVYAKGDTTPYTGTVVVTNEIGTKASTVEYKDGVPNGMLVSWYLNGNKQVEGVLHGKTQTGDWKAWYDNGQLKREGTYTDGKEEGPFNWYYEDGKKSKEGSYHDGIQTGIWSWYHENGQLMQQGELKGDTSEGEWKEWYEDGKPKMVGAFRNGEKQGPWTWWDANGEESTKTYWDGNITQASDSMDLFVERTNEAMEDHDLKRSLASVQQAMDRLDDRSESNPDYILLSILKAKVYAHFQRLEEAQTTLLNVTGIPQGDVLIIVAAHDSTAHDDLLKLEGRMLKYPGMQDRYGPHVALALVYNILRDSVAMRAQQKLVMDRADSAARGWIPKLSLTLYGLQADKEQAYGRLAYAKEEMGRDSITRENQLDLAAFLTDLGRFKEATPIVDKYLALDPKDLDFLIVKVNIASGSGDLPQMEKYRAQALSIDPHALDE